MDPLLILLIGMTVVVGGILLFRLHAFLVLIAGALGVGWLTSEAALKTWGESQGMSGLEQEALAQQPAIARLVEGFGTTCGKIGILIAMAAIIGKCMLQSGAAERIVRNLVRLFGESRAPTAFTVSGFLLGIPVFFDTVFYLLLPLAKTIGLRRPDNYLLYILTVCAGATMAHSLVPPTPGPLLVANEIGVDIGTMMLGGIVIGAIACGAGFGFAHWANRRWPLPLRSTPESPIEELRYLSRRSADRLPPFGLAILPIALPVVLIAGHSILKSLAPAGEFGAQLLNAAAFLGDKNLALTLAAVIALITLMWYQENRGTFEAVQTALASGGVIILITSAGGAFGGLLQQCGIGARIGALTEGWQLGVLPLAFGVTVLVRIAQGSATVAMITAVGIFAGLATTGQLGFHPVYLALAIGCGSKPYPWMNDSGFWVVCKMSGMTEAETLRSFSAMLAVMGLVGLTAVILFAWLFPLV